MAQGKVDGMLDRPKLVQKWDREHQKRKQRKLRDDLRAQQDAERTAELDKARSVKAVSSKIQYVYLIESNVTFKIGKTTDIKKRFLSIKGHSPLPLEIRHYFQCLDSRWVERRLHELFKDVRSHGEWFHLTKSDVAFICGLTSDNYDEAIREFDLERSLRNGD